MHLNQKSSSKSLFARWSNPCLLLLGLALALGAPGCSSVNTHVDKGPVRASTFSFLVPRADQLSGEVEARKEAHALIQHALVNTLVAKGLNQVPAGGDITVAYLLVVGNNVATTALDGYFGYSTDSQALVDEVHKEQTGSGSRGYFEAGTLVIDLVDPKTSKVLQRRSIHAQILRELPSEQRVARVQAIVDQALRDVPIAR